MASEPTGKWRGKEEMGLEIFVNSLPGICDAGLPIAASRAGCTGLLDLSLLDSANATPASNTTQDPWANIAHLIEQAASGRFGFILPPGDTGFNDFITARLNEVPCVVLTLPLFAASTGNDDVVIDAQSVKFWRQRAKRLGLVVTSAREAEAAARSGFDFVLAKGSDAGGLVGQETSYVLLQSVIAATDLDTYAWGGISHYTALACAVAGAAGVVLDWQLALLRESPVKGALKRRLEALDGSEAKALKLSTFKQWQLLDLPGMTAPGVLAAKIRSTTGSGSGQELRSEIIGLHARQNPKHQLVSLGQDAVFARHWANQYPTVAKALGALARYVEEQLPHTGENAFCAGSPLAQSHNTRYPIVQGPMTRVSDVPAFCDKVEQGGALPFLAVALLKGNTLTTMLRTTRELMGDRSWGVGLLAFNEPELFREQMAAVDEVRPPFAILSGGRADQALAMQESGTLTYLHAPSPSILTDYLQNGVRNFIFEGRECGGHIGPRTSFVLWSTMIDTLLASGLTDAEFADLKLLFAGGIHDAVSTAMVSALVQPLKQRGAQVGVLMGTAYIFTDEAVSTGAVVPKFQQIAQSSRYTEIADTGGGHAIRMAPTVYYETFLQEKARLEAGGLNPQEVRKALDESNIGRLRLASKGVYRKDAESGSALVEIDEAEQQREGVYMIGQVVALNDDLFSIEALHERVCEGASRFLLERHAALCSEQSPQGDDVAAAGKPLDIAIVGIATLLPGGANDRQSYWENILRSHDAITEIPADRFAFEDWFDADRNAPDKIYGKWGGFVDDILFDPLKFGIPPNSIPQIEPMQLIALKLTEQVLEDAGLLDDNPYLDRTGIILGIGGGAAELGSNYIVRSMLPRLLEDPSEELLENLPEWTEDSFAGILLNVVAGRVSNRFDFGGINFSVDAACASSLASVYLACRELSAGTSDVMIAGGCDTTQNPFGYLCFSKTGALSPRGRSSTFDANADGIVISEGHAAVVLKRLSDAERDGDRIYGVIKAASSGSDGKSMGLTAPRVEGQLRTLKRAYEQAGYSPATVGLFEAHGTGTAVGDRTEALALGQLLSESGAPDQSVAIGSVKSMIGHTKCAAGIAGLIKSVLALHHKVLPPTMNVARPSADARLVDGPLYVNSELRPWISPEQPRRASVSSFGFGGTNFHVAMEEYTRSAVTRDDLRLRNEMASELFVFNARSAAQLQKKLGSFAAELAVALEQSAEVSLAQLAYCLHLDNERVQFSTAESAANLETVAIVAESLAGLLEQLTLAQQLFDEGHIPTGKREEAIEAARLKNVFAASDPLVDGGNVCFLFPGQGSQYLNMQRDLALEFSELVQSHHRADKVLASSLPAPLSRYIFPRPFFTDEDRRAAFDMLKQTDITQPALGVSSVGMLHLLRSFGIAPDAVAGHSYGEFVALYAAGCLDESSLYGLSFARGDAIMQMTAQNTGMDLGGMLATSADREVLAELLEGIDNCWVSNLNSPRQTILSGTREGLATVAQLLEKAELAQVPIPVGCAFHSPIMAGARERLVDALSQAEFAPATIPVMSNVTGEAYPRGDAENTVQQYRSLLEAQLTSPVRFQEQVENLYDDGFRVFIEVGPGNVLSRLVTQIVGDKPHAAISTNMEAHNDVTAFQCALAQMIVQGMEVDCERLYSGRQLEPVRLASLNKQTRVEPRASMWWLNGSYARPVGQPPRKFGPKFKLQNELEMAKIRQQLQAQQTAPRAVGQSQPQDMPAPAAAAMNPDSVSMPPLPAGTIDLRSQAMLGFQQNMRKFIETQQAVMTAYFQSRGTSVDGSAGVASAAAQQPAPAPVAAPTGSATVPGKPADFPAVQVSPADVPKADASPVAAPPASAPAQPALDLQQILVDMISQKTGYPTDILDPDANLEAELGIDSIKRVEVIAAFRKVVLPGMDSPGQDYMEKMSAVQSINDILAVIRPYVGDVAAAPADAAAAPSTAAAPASAPAQPALDLQEILVDMISQKTGYPPEVLDPDANLEAELGIDSIKRVEVIAAFRKVVLPGMDSPGQDYMEKMSAVQSINDILNVIRPYVNREETATAVPATEAQDKAVSVDKPVALAPAIARARAEEICPRCVVMPVPAALEAAATPALAEGAYLLVYREDDKEQAALCKALTKALSTRKCVGVPVAVDKLSDRAVAERLVQEARSKQGGVVGFIHLAAIGDSTHFPDVDSATIHALIEQETGSLLYLLQALDEELQGANGNAFAALCATVGGGEFSLFDAADAGEPDTECRYPWRGALAGLVKCAAKEWPAARFATVDFDDSPTADLLISELGHAGAGEVEIGYRAGERLALIVAAESLEPEQESPALLTREDTVLVTGGARGITAEVAKSFAAASGAHMILVGRSAAPVPESEDTRSIETPIELRKILVARAKASGEIPQPKLLEQALKALLANREINNTLASIQAAGGSAEYVSCDVSDPAAFAELLTTLRTKHDITGIIHGAGIIEDKAIVDKSAESFHRVINTKVDPVLGILKHLDIEKLKVCLLFSSVAGYFGNRGQGDYAAANEILNRIGRWMQQDIRRKGLTCKVAALNWGPWSGAGMVTEEVERQFRSRGVGLIEPRGGCKAAWNEALAASAAPVRVILGPGSWEGIPVGSSRIATELPLLHDQSVYRLSDGSITAQVTLDSRAQAFLEDHIIDGNPVLPLAVATELMVETAALAKPDWQISRVEALRLFEGVVIPAEYREITVRAECDEESAQRSSWRVAIFDPARKIRPLYECRVTLEPEIEDAGKLDAGVAPCKTPYPKSAEDAYKDWLFHGPAYQSIRAIAGYDQQGIDAEINTDSTALVASGRDKWIVNPLVLDTVAQMAILWSRANYNTTLLPNALGNLQRFAADSRASEADQVIILTRFEPDSGDETYTANAWVVADGKVIYHIDGLEGFGNAEINRIAS